MAARTMERDFGDLVQEWVVLMPHCLPPSAWRAWSPAMVTLQWLSRSASPAVPQSKLGVTCQVIGSGVLRAKRAGHQRVKGLLITGQEKGQNDIR